MVCPLQQEGILATCSCRKAADGVQLIGRACLTYASSICYMTHAPDL